MRDPLPLSPPFDLHAVFSPPAPFLRTPCPAGNIKLGDFGLAKDNPSINRVDSRDALASRRGDTGPSLVSPPTVLSTGHSGSGEAEHYYDDSFTTGVGTRLYSAPEQSSQSERRCVAARRFPGRAAACSDETGVGVGLRAPRVQPARPWECVHVRVRWAWAWAALLCPVCGPVALFLRVCSARA